MNVINCIYSTAALGYIANGVVRARHDIRNVSVILLLLSLAACNFFAFASFVFFNYFIICYFILASLFSVASFLFFYCCVARKRWLVLGAYTVESSTKINIKCTAENGN